MDTTKIVETVKTALENIERSDRMKINKVLSSRHNPDPAGEPLKFVEFQKDETHVGYKVKMPNMVSFWFHSSEEAQLATTYSRARMMRDVAGCFGSTHPVMKTFEIEGRDVFESMPIEWWRERQYEPLTEDREHVCAIVAHILKTVPLATEAIAEALLYLKENPQESIDLALATGSAEWDK